MDTGFYRYLYIALCAVVIVFVFKGYDRLRYWFDELDARSNATKTELELARFFAEMKDVSGELESILSDAKACIKSNVQWVTLTLASASDRAEAITKLEALKLDRVPLSVSEGWLHWWLAHAYRIIFTLFLLYFVLYFLT